MEGIPGAAQCGGARRLELAEQDPRARAGRASLHELRHRQGPFPAADGADRLHADGQRRRQGGDRRAHPQARGRRIPVHPIVRIEVARAPARRYRHEGRVRGRDAGLHLLRAAGAALYRRIGGSHWRELEGFAVFKVSKNKNSRNRDLGGAPGRHRRDRLRVPDAHRHRARTRAVAQDPRHRPGFRAARARLQGADDRTHRDRHCHRDPRFSPGARQAGGDAQDAALLDVGGRAGGDRLGHPRAALFARGAWVGLHS